MIENLPKPSPDMREYESELSAILSSSRSARENYEKYRHSERVADIKYEPIKMDFENVSRCNFRCSKCQISGWKGQKRAADMAFHDFKEVIDSQHGLVEIKLQGMGEPVLGGKIFFRMIEYARRKHIWVRTTTNASILHKHENFRKLIDADPNEVQISIDGTSKETFERIRAGSNFELVTQNCKLINGYCNSLGLLKTRMWVCLQRENFSEFLDFVKLADELGFHRLSFALNLHGWGQMEYFNKNKALSVDEELSFDLAMEAIRLGRKFGIDVSFWNNVSKYDSKKRETICPWPFERAYISSDMRIVPCCMIANPDILDFGDARDFLERWHSREYVEFRMAHLEGAVPDACRGCYVDTEREE